MANKNDENWKLKPIQTKTTIKNRTSVSQVKSDIKAYYDQIERVLDASEKKIERIREERKEASRLVSLANKRVRRLEKNNLTNAPAYKMYIADGGKPFSIKGKDINQVRAEVARLNRFINAKTSTITGINNHLKEMASITGLKYKNLSDLRTKSTKFFELASKVEQYLRTVEDMASAINYNEIWQSINNYVEMNKIDLADSKRSVEDMIGDVTNALKEYERPVSVGGEKFKLLND